MLTEWSGNETCVSILDAVDALCTPTDHAEPGRGEHGARATFERGRHFAPGNWSNRFRWKHSTNGSRWMDSCFEESCRLAQLAHQQRSPRDICSCCVKERRHEARPSSAPPAAAAEMSREMSQNSSNVVEVELPSIGTVGDGARAK